MDPTSKSVTITLTNNRQHRLLFDLNTFYEFEEKSGKTLPGFLLEMERAFAPLSAKKSTPATDGASALQVTDQEVISALSHVSIKDLRALIWAALHDYDNRDEPHWPYTIGQLGKLIDHKNLSKIITELMSGIGGALPNKKESDNSRPTQDPSSLNPNGGVESGSLDETILDSLPKRSAN